MTNQSGADLNQRITHLESRAAITDLVHRYAFNIRRGQPRDCEGLFTEDATFELREADATAPAEFKTNRLLNNRDAIMSFIGQLDRPGVRNYPLIYNLLIDIDGAAAQASSMMTVRHFPGGNKLTGEYQDSFRLEGVWRFSGRIHTIYREPN